MEPQDQPARRGRSSPSVWDWASGLRVVPRGQLELFALTGYRTLPAGFVQPCLPSRLRDFSKLLRTAMAIPKIQRPDFSHSLVHLTRDRRVYRWDAQMTKQKLTEDVPAFEVLKEILLSGTIRGSGNDGFVKGNRRAVCLSEIPLSAIRQFADPPDMEPKHKYRMYGVMLSKAAVFEAGGRPVIYLPDPEGGWNSSRT